MCSLLCMAALTATIDSGGAYCMTHESRIQYKLGGCTCPAMEESHALVRYWSDNCPDPQWCVGLLPGLGPRTAVTRRTRSGFGPCRTRLSRPRLQTHTLHH